MAYGRYEAYLELSLGLIYLEMYETLPEPLSGVMFGVCETPPETVRQAPNDKEKENDTLRRIVPHPDRVVRYPVRARSSDACVGATHSLSRHQTITKRVKAQLLMQTHMQVSAASPRDGFDLSYLSQQERISSLSRDG